MKEFSFGKISLILLMLKNEFEILWIIDYNTWRQRRYGYLKSLEPEYPLTTDKPFEELVAGSDEHEPITYKR